MEARARLAQIEAPTFTLAFDITYISTRPHTPSVARIFVACAMCALPCISLDLHGLRLKNSSSSLKEHSRVNLPDPLLYCQRP